MASYLYQGWYDKPNTDQWANDPIIQNFNYLWQNGTQAGAFDYLMKNWFRLKDSVGLTNQLKQQYGLDAYRKITQQYGVGALDNQDRAIRDALMKNLPYQKTPMQEYQERRAARGLPPDRMPGQGGLRGMNPATAPNPAAATQRYGDYTYSRYDDGMQHLAQMNDPTWQTYGDPNRGSPVGAAQMGQAQAQQPNLAVPQPMPTGASNNWGTVGNQGSQSNMSPTPPQPTPVPSAPAPNTNGTYVTSPQRFRWR